MKKRHLVIALPAVRGRTIGAHALTRARILAKYFDVTVISNSFPTAVPEQVQCLPVTTRSFDALRRFCHVPNELSFAYAVREELKRLHTRAPIDFLLCHGYTLTRFVGREFFRCHAVRYGMFMHGHIFTRPRGTYDWRVTAFYRWMAPVCYREAHLIFALSPDQMNLAFGAGASAQNVVLAPNGIIKEDLDSAGVHVRTEEVAGRERNRLRILYIGRLSTEKGVDTLFAACEQLAKWKVDYSLTVIGDGPRSKSLSGLAQRTGIANRVKFLKAVPRGHLGAYYRSTDVLCVPSSDEPLGNVVLEGLVSGCLVVGSEVGGIRFIISDGVDGYLVPPEMPLKWAEKLLYISENKGSLGSLSKEGQDMVSRRFDWEKIVLEMHDAISRAIA